MAVDWRTTLKTLRAQFEAAAARSPGLAHLFVEAANSERSKIIGPPWFSGRSEERRVVAGKLQYSAWDYCSSCSLPGVHAAFREPKAGETFGEADADRVIRDLSGIARAVAVPMKLRRGFYCGQPSEEAAKFKSLANAAATALAGSNDLNKNAFASDLTDIFRKPCGDVRYIFGEVPSAPAHFVSQGWIAGILQFERGVLIDVPISENSPDAKHWVLLLHRLGWHRFEESALRASRFAWTENFEVELDLLVSESSRFPNGVSNQFAGVSPDSFYSLLGTKAGPTHQIRREINRF